MTTFPIDPDPSYQDLRQLMVERQLSPIQDQRVLAAMRMVPRHLFVPKSLRDQAYADRPLPIGHGQTISQPLMVARMLEAAELEGHERVLEVGAGSGYQAALLSRLAKEVRSIEVIPELVQMARQNLAQDGFGDVQVLLGNGSLGWPQGAPYDVIIVAAGAPSVPEPLVDQLAESGRLIIPVGAHPFQVLKRVTREPAGIVTEDLELCSFVPLVGAHGVGSRKLPFD